MQIMSSNLAEKAHDVLPIDSLKEPYKTRAKVRHMTLYKRQKWAWCITTFREPFCSSWSSSSTPSLVLKSELWINKFRSGWSIDAKHVESFSLHRDVKARGMNELTPNIEPDDIANGHAKQKWGLHDMAQQMTQTEAQHKKLKGGGIGGNWQPNGSDAMYQTLSCSGRSLHTFNNHKMSVHPATSRCIIWMIDISLWQTTFKVM